MPLQFWLTLLYDWDQSVFRRWTVWNRVGAMVMHFWVTLLYAVCANCSGLITMYRRSTVDKVLIKYCWATRHCYFPYRLLFFCMQLGYVRIRHYIFVRMKITTFALFFVPNIDIVFILLVDEVLCSDTKPVQSLVAAPVKPSLDFDFLSCLEFATCRFWIKIPNYTSIYSNKSW
jgi:hypothetical protein